MSVKSKILAYLSKTDTDYNTLTAAQIRAKWGVSDVTSRIAELRKEGNAIYLNNRTLDDGRKVSFYRLGKPTKAVVAAGVEALRAEGINAFA